MVMAVRVIVVVIMPVVMPAVRAVHMRCGGRLGVAVVTVVAMIVMCMAAMVMAGMRGRTVSATLGFKSFVHRVHDQVHGA